MGIGYLQSKLQRISWVGGLEDRDLTINWSTALFRTLTCNIFYIPYGKGMYYNCEGNPFSI